MTKKLKIYPSKEYLLECFDYNRETGELFWKKRPAEHFENARAWRSFNSKFVGKLAGVIAGDGFRKIQVYFGNAYQCSTLIHILETGKPNPRPITHINGDNSDDRFNNLSLVRNDTKGCRLTDVGNWQSEIVYNGNRYHIGNFKTEKEATDAYLKAVDNISKSRFVHRSKVNSTGRKGVSKDSGKFVANVWFNNRQQRLGAFNTVEEASLAYKKAKQEIKEGVFIPTSEPRSNRTGFAGVAQTNYNKFAAQYGGKYIGTFNTPEEAHEAYLKAKNPPLSFNAALDVLASLGTKIQ
jgi:hypothetical protein